MLDFTKHVFVGVDPHKNQHTLAVLDGFRQELTGFNTPATLVGFRRALEKVLESASDGLVPIFGIEDTGGLGRPFAQWLVGQGYLVKGVNPIMSSGARRRRPHPDKTDALDANAVSKVLMDEFSNLPTVQDDAQAKALNEATRRRNQLVRQRTRCKNELHVLLHDNYPEYKTFFAKPFGKAALAFWYEYPHPSELQNVGGKRLGSFLNKEARNLSQGRAEHILAHADKRTPLTLDARMRMTTIRQLIEQFRQLEEHIAQLEAILAEEVERSDSQLATMHGVSVVIEATILARVGGRDFGTSSQLAKHAGVAPQDNDTGDRGRKRKSKSGDRQLNAALHRIALSQIAVTRDGLPRCPVAYEYYQRKIREGKTKLGALTCLKRRLCDIIFAMLRDGTAYRVPTRSPRQAA